MNLAYHYPSIYWATAVITVDAGALDSEEDSSGTNYKKVATAIGRVQTEGYKIELPDINKASFGFKPDVKNNKIFYGLKGITGINDDFIRTILANRPYSSMNDFIEKVNPQKKQMITLIKSGAFDSFGERGELMINYMKIIFPKKEHVSLQNMSFLIENKMIPNDLISYVYLYNFNKYLKNLETPNGFKIDKRAKEFLLNNFPNLDYDLFLDTKIWKKTYEKGMSNFKDWIKNNERFLIDEIQKKEIQNIWNQYCPGNYSTWEMDTLGFYSHEHELINLKEEVSSIKELKEGTYKELYLIAGTVLGKEAYKHIVTILTPDGVIDLKFTNEQFANYNRIISQKLGESKKVMEKSWFLKGTLLMAKGCKIGEVFRVKELSKIVSLDEFGNAKTTRYRYQEG